MKKKCTLSELPRILVARTWCFHCHDLGLVPDQGTKILPTTRHGSPPTTSPKLIGTSKEKNTKEVIFYISDYFKRLKLDSIIHTNLYKLPCGGHFSNIHQNSIYTKLLIQVFHL